MENWSKDFPPAVERERETFVWFDFKRQIAIDFDTLIFELQLFLALNRALPLKWKRDLCWLFDVNQLTSSAQLQCKQMSIDPARSNEIEREAVKRENFTTMATALYLEQYLDSKQKRVYIWIVLLICIHVYSLDIVECVWTEICRWYFDWGV